jgi:hypothetical protein
VGHTAGALNVAIASPRERNPRKAGISAHRRRQVSRDEAGAPRSINAFRVISSRLGAAAVLDRRWRVSAWNEVGDDLDHLVGAVAEATAGIDEFVGFEHQLVLVLRIGGDGHTSPAAKLEQTLVAEGP